MYETISSGLVSDADPFRDFPAAPKHDDPVGNLEDIGDVVADEHYGAAALGKTPRQGQDLAVSATASAAVGSSMITSLAFRLSARQMATAWRWPPDRLPTGASGSEIWASSSLSRPRHAASFLCDAGTERRAPSA